MTQFTAGEQRQSSMQGARASELPSSGARLVAPPRQGSAGIGRPQLRKATGLRKRSNFVPNGGATGVNPTSQFTSEQFIATDVVLTPNSSAMFSLENSAPVGHTRKITAG